MADLERRDTEQSPSAKANTMIFKYLSTVEIPSSKAFHHNFFTLRYDWVTRYKS